MEVHYLVGEGMNADLVSILCEAHLFASFAFPILSGLGDLVWDPSWLLRHLVMSLSEMQNSLQLSWSCGDWWHQTMWQHVIHQVRDIVWTYCFLTAEHNDSP